MHIALGSRRPGRSVVYQSSANTARKTPSQFILGEEKKKKKRRKWCRFSWIIQQMQHVESYVQQQHARRCCITHEQQQRRSHLLIRRPSTHESRLPGAMRGAGRVVSGSISTFSRLHDARSRQLPPGGRPPAPRPHHLQFSDCAHPQPSFAAMLSSTSSLTDL